MLENIKQAKNWEDRYRFIIQAGKHLSQPSPDELAQMQSIQGCEAGLWFKPIPQHDGTFQFQAYGCCYKTSTAKPETNYNNLIFVNFLMSLVLPLA